MFEWSMLSIQVWLSICFSLLANSLSLSALKTSVSLLLKKSISHEHLTDLQIYRFFHFFITSDSHHISSLYLKASENFDHYTIMKFPILNLLVPLMTQTEFLFTLSVWYQVDTSNENKETHQLGNYWLIPFQILQPNITLKCMADSKENYGWNLESERVKTHMVIICTRQQINVSSNSSKVFLCIRNFRSHLN